MSDDPALEAHEHNEMAEESAHRRDPFVSQVSATVAILALLAASVSAVETIEAGAAITSASDAVLAQEKATDAWGEYQADSLKRHIYGIAADAHTADLARYAGVEAQQQAAQKMVQGQAKDFEKERDTRQAESLNHEKHHHWLTGAATLLEIGIAICTLAIITRRRSFWLASLGLGAGGLVLFGLAYLL